MPGLFITFEGVEGAGKTTQVALLRAALETRGLSVFVTREPGGNAVGEAIRSILLSGENPVTDCAELLLFLAARAQLVEREIRPRLEASEIVICDRYIDSTIAYQGYARGNDLELVARLNAFATGGLKPDITFLLDLQPEEGLARQMDRNRMETQSLEFHRAVRMGFLTIAAADPSRIRILDAREPAASLHESILQAIPNR